MKAPKELKPALWGAAGGAVVLAILGFTWGGWVTGGSASAAAKKDADQAVVEALASICVYQFDSQADVAAKLGELKDLASFKQAGFVEEGGWATMPGSEKPVSGVARTCASRLVDAG